MESTWPPVTLAEYFGAVCSRDPARVAHLYARMTGDRAYLRRGAAPRVAVGEHLDDLASGDPDRIAALKARGRADADAEAALQALPLDPIEPPVDLDAGRHVVRECRRHGVELAPGDREGKVSATLRRPLAADVRRRLRAAVAEHRAAVLTYLWGPAPEKLLAAVAATGRGPLRRSDPHFHSERDLLPRWMARELSLLPPPPPPTRWQLLVSDYRIAWSDGPHPAWVSKPATGPQLALLRRLGHAPPAGVTRGEASYAISAIKRGDG
jgi:hypothetical protein